ncbi:MAG TPA: hypothetical protein VGM91_01525 [Conexibacter sp.]|jgi:hypothetical protein
MTTRRPLLLLALAAALAGVLLALVLAFTLPDAKPAPADAAAAGGDPFATTASKPDDPAHPSIGRSRADVRGFRQSWMRALGPTRIEARAPDPRGGPPWAVRVVTAQNLIERRDGSLFPTGKPQQCAQLGRIYHGQFGWIDAANRFRAAVGMVYRSNPIRCERAADLRHDPQLEVLTRVSDPAHGAPRPLQSVVWGFGGTTAQRVGLQVGGRARSVAPTPAAAVLLPLGSGARPSVSATFRYGGGRSVVVDDSFGGWNVKHDAEFARWAGLSSVRPRAGAVPTLEYRLADPGGGPPLGIAAAPATDGGWCVSGMGTIVGDRVGAIDRGLGTFLEAGPTLNSGCSSPGGRPTRRRPLSVSFGLSVAAGGSAGLERFPQARRAHIVRRALPGKTTVTGVASPAVVSITIATPRDVRTITPSPRAHVFAVVYDGGFPTGEIALTARLRDGTTYSEPPLMTP